MLVYGMKIASSQTPGEENFGVFHLDFWKMCASLGLISLIRSDVLVFVMET